MRVWLPQVAILGYLTVVVVSMVVGLFFAAEWISTPFLGGLLGPEMTYREVQPDWSGARAGLTQGDRVLTVNGAPIQSAAQLKNLLAEQRLGQVVSVEVERVGGETIQLALPVTTFGQAQRWAYFYIPSLLGLVYLVIGIWVFAVRRSRPAGRMLALFSISTSVVLGGLFDLFSTHHLVWLWAVSLGISGASAISLGFLFPREDALVTRRPAVQWVGALIGMLAALNVVIRLNNRLPGLNTAIQILVGFGCLAILFTFGWAIFRRARTVVSSEREQLRFITLSGILSYGPLLVLLALSLFIPIGAYPSVWVLIPLGIFPLAVSYMMTRYRLQQTDYVISRGLLYLLMAILVAVGYALIVSGLSLLLGRPATTLSPVIVGLVFFVLALLLNPLRERMQRLVDIVFFRGQGAYQQRLSSYSADLARVVDLRGILRTLRQYIEEALMPSAVHIYLYDAMVDQYIAAAGKDGRQTTDLRFISGSPLIRILSENRSSLVLKDLDNLPAGLHSERSRLTLLGATVFIGLPSRERLAGWIALGPRLSGEAYSMQELGFLESLCDNSALAIERAQVLENMENRVRQMNVLARVAQGVNITLTLDDILELIFAQTTQVVPAEVFHIMLYDRQQDTHQYVFYLEGDDRLNHMENKAVPANTTLEQEVVRSGRAILTDDYNQECIRRAVGAPAANIFSWMAVPLNTGAETIGALSLGSKDSKVEYTSEQQSLAQAIADQVAGAIVKARLLQETERRALQLTTLNEVTRQLTSTLELEPLLQNILQSAVDILICEAGSLLLVDETTEEMVFRVVVSPVAHNLVNTRMPPGAGVVGKSVTTRQPIIVNDVTRYPEWFSKTDQQTGFVTRALLVIPLQVKDRVIGVIEVINKRDGSPFSQDDQDLLSAFAAQAAVAIENARLYTMTDQALAARVEELSVMQRIDRELNTSLDTTRAMRITLEWAMRQSDAMAGLVGIVTEENGLQVMASQGYTNEMESHRDGILPMGYYGLEDAVHDGIPLRRQVSEGGSANFRLLSGARWQTLVPIRRETTTIGLLLLETGASDAVNEETINFLARLTDHASIAIFNAQLYSAVQAANLAKSEFVSFVAHELKNPMTSVKGYTELLAAGAVGPINDAQTNFLHTIRANIERMNTLVSDLNDMSKIEVGRLRLEFKGINLAEVVEGTVRSTKRQLDDKKQQLSVEIPPDLPQAWADRTRMEQVMVNLVSNAHKYTPEGGQVLVKAELSENIWDPGGAPEVLHIWVKDTGIGISEEDQKKIFQKFFRSDDPKTREAPGTGLGLNITKSLVEMQGGQIWFESEFRKGTTFHFTVPIAAQ